MDTTLGKSDECICRCCSKNFHLKDQLYSLFEYTSEEMELYKILMTLAPISICRNDGFSEKICSDCRCQAINSYRFRLMCVSTDESVRCNRKPFVTNNEHDYSTWNINDYDDLSEYLIGTKDETIQPLPEIPDPQEIDETQNFDLSIFTKKARRYSCPVCDKLWVTPSKLKRHMSVHRIIKARSESKPIAVTFEVPHEQLKQEPEVQCPICFLAIETQAKLADHMMVHHKTKQPKELPSCSPEVPIAHKIGKRRYLCTVCNSESTTPAKLQQHMKLHHTISTKVLSKKSTEVCEICSESFQNTTSLIKHQNSSHCHPKKPKRRKTPRRHTCLHCDKKFETPSKLHRHQSVHRDLPKVSKCDVLDSSILEITAVTNILGD